MKKGHGSMFQKKALPILPADKAATDALAARVAPPPCSSMASSLVLFRSSSASPYDLRYSNGPRCRPRARSRVVMEVHELLHWAERLCGSQHNSPGLSLGAMVEESFPLPRFVPPLVSRELGLMSIMDACVVLKILPPPPRKPMRASHVADSRST